MTYTTEIREQAIRMMAKDKPFYTIFETLNISLSTLYQWYETYQDEIIKLREEINVSKQIGALISSDNLSKALILCENENFKDCLHIQSQRITILIKLKRYNNALKICNNPEFKDYLPIQSQKVTILIKLKKLQKALTFCNNPRFKDKSPIQSQKVTVLMRLNRLEEALSICEDERFKDSEYIQAQKIEILIRLGRYDEASKFSEDKEFKNSQFYKSLLKRISDNNQAAQEQISIPTTRTISILHSILNNEYTLEDLNNYNLLPIEIFIITIAYYESNNYPIDLIKRYIKAFIKNNDNSENSKIITIIKERISTKVKIFDISFYINLLNECPNDLIKIQNEREYYLKLIDLLKRMQTSRMLTEEQNPIRHK